VARLGVSVTLVGGKAPAVRRILPITALSVGWLIAVYLAYALLAPIPAVLAIPQPIAIMSTPTAAVTLPNYGASAIGATDSSQIFSGTDLDSARPIASITKIVTALVVLDRYPIAEGQPGELLTLTAADAQLRQTYAGLGGSIAAAPTGLTISQRHVIDLMMVQSANNYAETLAVWAFGSVDAYLIEARMWLQRHQLTAITVADTTGFPLNNTASPRALLQLGRIALANPVLAASAELPAVTVPGVGTYANRNLIVGVDGVIGLKTGTLDEAGACLLFAAEHQIDGETLTVIGVVLGGPDHAQVAADVRSLLSSVRDDYHTLLLPKEGTTVAIYDAPWGEQVRLQVADTVDALVWGEVQARTTLNTPTLQPGVHKASPPLTVRYGGEVVEIALTLDGRLSGPGLAWKIRQPIVELFDR
jgi:D-alanyl-D-alanine carboxypeptidase (penicillin-binding protein 5/6)